MRYVILLRYLGETKYDVIRFPEVFRELPVVSAKPDTHSLQLCATQGHVPRRLATGVKGSLLRVQIVMGCIPSTPLPPSTSEETTRKINALCRSAAALGIQFF